MLLDFRNKFTHLKPYTCKLFTTTTTSSNKENNNIFHINNDNDDSDNDDSDNDNEYDNEIMTMDNNESAAISLSMLKSLEHELPLLKGDDFNAYPLIPTIVEYVDGDLFMIKKQDTTNTNSTTNSATTTNNNDNDDEAYTLQGWQCKVNDDHKPNYNNILAYIILNGIIIIIIITKITIIIIIIIMIIFIIR